MDKIFGERLAHDSPLDKILLSMTVQNEFQSSRRKTKVFFLLSFSDLSHHRTCRSAYGGSLHSVQLNVVVH